MHQEGRLLAKPAFACAAIACSDDQVTKYDRDANGCERGCPTCVPKCATSCEDESNARKMCMSGAPQSRIIDRASQCCTWGCIGDDAIQRDTAPVVQTLRAHRCSPSSPLLCRLRWQCFKQGFMNLYIVYKHSEGFISFHLGFIGNTSASMSKSSEKSIFTTNQGKPKGKKLETKTKKTVFLLSKKICVTVEKISVQHLSAFRIVDVEISVQNEIFVVHHIGHKHV
jgi:hypothetical protein